MKFTTRKTKSISNDVSVTYECEIELPDVGLDRLDENFITNMCREVLMFNNEIDYRDVIENSEVSQMTKDN